MLNFTPLAPLIRAPSTLTLPILLPSIVSPPFIAHPAALGPSADRDHSPVPSSGTSPSPPASNTDADSATACKIAWLPISGPNRAVPVSAFRSASESASRARDSSVESTRSSIESTQSSSVGSLQFSSESDEMHYSASSKSDDDATAAHLKLDQLHLQPPLQEDGGLQTNKIPLFKLPVDIRPANELRAVAEPTSTLPPPSISPPTRSPPVEALAPPKNGKAYDRRTEKHDEMQVDKLESKLEPGSEPELVSELELDNEREHRPLLTYQSSALPSYDYPYFGDQPLSYAPYADYTMPTLDCSYHPVPSLSLPSLRFQVPQHQPPPSSACISSSGSEGPLRLSLTLPVVGPSPLTPNFPSSAAFSSRRRMPSYSQRDAHSASLIDLVTPRTQSFLDSLQMPVLTPSPPTSGSGVSSASSRLSGPMSSSPLSARVLPQRKGPPPALHLPSPFAMSALSPPCQPTVSLAAVTLDTPTTRFGPDYPSHSPPRPTPPPLSSPHHTAPYWYITDQPYFYYPPPSHAPFTPTPWQQQYPSRTPGSSRLNLSTRRKGRPAALAVPARSTPFSTIPATLAASQQAVTGSGSMALPSSAAPSPSGGGDGGSRSGGATGFVERTPTQASHTPPRPLRHLPPIQPFSHHQQWQSTLAGSLAGPLDGKQPDFFSSGQQRTPLSAMRTHEAIRQWVVQEEMMGSEYEQEVRRG